MCIYIYIYTYVYMICGYLHACLHALQKDMQAHLLIA